MKIKIKTMTVVGLFILSVYPAFAQSVGSVANGNMKTSANIENTCLISVDDINFGQVYAPLTTQGSQSQMRVQCSNKASYTIGLAYGGVYGSGSSSSGYSVKYNGNNAANDYVRFIIYNSSNVKVGDMWCSYSSGRSVFFSTTEAANVYGAKTGNWQSGSGICVSDGKAANTYPVGFDNTNQTTAQEVMRGVSYSYGVMNGGLKGDKLAYKITVPGDVTKVWNNGIGSYTSTGTGSEQVIDFNAQIVPGNSSSLYVAQDFYSDTVTAVIAY